MRRRLDLHSSPLLSISLYGSVLKRAKQFSPSHTKSPALFIITASHVEVIMMTINIINQGSPQSILLHVSFNPFLLHQSPPITTASDQPILSPRFCCMFLFLHSDKSTCSSCLLMFFCQMGVLLLLLFFSQSVHILFV